MSAARRLAWAWLTCGVVLTGCGGGDDVQQNNAFLRTLPQLPGARQLETASAPYYDEAGGPPVGHTTSIVYAAPTDDARRVIGFYSSRLRSRWRCRRESVGAWLLHCTRGSALLAVDTDDMRGAKPRFEVTVDHQGASRSQ